MADDFTRQKFVWLDQVANDPLVSAQAFRAGYFIACRFLNRGTGDAFPSQDTLARLIGLTTSKGVRYLIDQLVAGGHLDVTAAHGRGQTNRYRLLVKGPVAESPGGQSGKNATAPTTTHFEPAKTISNQAACDQHPDKVPESQDPLPDFESWWQQYPKKVSKGAARKAYGRIVSSGAATPAELLAGAMRYAATRTDQDPRYTKDPGGWLNAERWTDEIEVPPQGGAPVTELRSGSSWTEIALEGLHK
jgi:hypothetical protein